MHMHFRLYIAAEDGIMHARCHHRSHVLVNFDIDYPACVLTIQGLVDTVALGCARKANKDGPCVYR